MLGFILFQIVSGSRTLVDSSEKIRFVRDIRGTGLKQELHTSIELLLPMDCVLFERISKEWFIDVEEVPKDLLVSFESNIDIELPSALSKEYNFNIRFNKSTQFILPIHLRYNECSYTQKYKEVFLPNPVVQCNGEKVRISGEEISALVPVGDLRDREIVIGTSVLAVVLAVIWIVSSIFSGVKR